jgi:hypothetical protein
MVRPGLSVLWVVGLCVSKTLLYVTSPLVHVSSLGCAIIHVIIVCHQGHLTLPNYCIRGRRNDFYGCSHHAQYSGHRNKLFVLLSTLQNNYFSEGTSQRQVTLVSLGAGTKVAGSLPALCAFHSGLEAQLSHLCSDNTWAFKPTCHPVAL